MARRPFTSVPVRPDTLERLKDYRMGGMSYDDVLNHFMDEVAPESVIAHGLKRRRTVYVDWDAVREAMGGT